MVDVTIPDLTAGAAVADADLFESSQSGSTAKSTAAEIFTYINSKTFTSLELQRYSETVATGSATLDRADGGIQTFTMTANITLAVTIAAGESLTFHLSAGDTYTVTWPTITWVGGSAPTLTAADVIEFWKIGSTLYGAYVGAV